MPTRDEILQALTAVIDPELRRSIVELEMVRSIDARADGTVDVTVSLTTPGCPIRSHFENAVRSAVGGLQGVTRVNVAFDVLSEQEKSGLQQKLGRGALPEGALAQVSNVVCVGSGKGGVGKSTITANLAVALAAQGKKVGVLDADVWGYSIPRMFDVGGRPQVSPDRKILPLENYGVKVMSIGFFVEEDSAVVWRGPMLHKALTQFLEDVEWGELDFLLVDLPPGTGDVSMTLAQLLPQAKFLIVTTPQPVAQKVARRAAEMAHKVNLEIGGVIENMAGFVTPVGRALRAVRRGRRPGAGRRARRPADRQGAAHDAAARAGRQRPAARARGPRRPRGPGGRPRRARPRRDVPARAADPPDGDGRRRGGRRARRPAPGGHLPADGG